MTMPEVIEFIDRYASTVDAPVRTGTTVTDVRSVDGGYRVTTDQGAWEAPTVMLASGGSACHLPDLAADAPDSVEVISPLDYRRPDQLPTGGSSWSARRRPESSSRTRSTGRGGRSLCVGEHVRMPRLYRGRDVTWWMRMAGVWDERYDEIDDLVRGRNIPSPQLVGTPDRATLDLNALTAQGVALVGRLGAIRDGVALFSGSLRNVCSLADLKLGRLLDRFDEWALGSGVDGDVDPRTAWSRLVSTSSRRSRWISAREIAAIVWATGFRSDYSWLQVPVLDRKGRLRHDGGVVTGAPACTRSD